VTRDRERPWRRASSARFLTAPPSIMWLHSLANCERLLPLQPTRPLRAQRTRLGRLAVKTSRRRLWRNSLGSQPLQGGPASASARCPTERDGESRPSNIISPPQARRARCLHPPFLPAILGHWASLIKTENTHLVLGHPHQRGAQRKREPSGVRPQKLSLPARGGKFPTLTAS